MAFGTLGVGVEAQTALGSIGCWESGKAFSNVVRFPGAHYPDHDGRGSFTSPSVVGDKPSALVSKGQSSIEGGKFIGYLSQRFRARDSVYQNVSYRGV